MSIKIIILAAGKGSRMHSNLPKVLQPLASFPLLTHVIKLAKTLSNNNITTVVGHGADAVKQAMAEFTNISYVQQTQQLGTGHAVQQADANYNDDDTVLVLYGDVPLTKTKTLQNLLNLVDDKHPLAVLTITLANSSGYGRIIRNQDNQVVSIVEEKDATELQKQVKEVNTGIMAVKGKLLRKWLAQLSCDNQQQEYYLTDIIAMCVADNLQVATSQPTAEIEVLGVNNKQQLQDLERSYQQQLALELMANGVSLIDANRIDVRGVLSVGKDVLIDVNNIFIGTVIIADNVTIGSNCVISNTTIAAGTVIKPFSHIDGANIGKNCYIGPYARLRQDTKLADGVKIGNFVETKKTTIGINSKISHLSYIGDTLMGEDCNIGAGTITCNYDGVNKHQTTIGDRVFVGSSSQLVAPLVIVNDVVIGAGSTITKNINEKGLSLTRANQVTIKGWQKSIKK